FVLTHGVQGAEPTLVFALAGFVYGLIYTLTKSIAAAIAVHFFVNILHFSFFTYPLA
ncbi:MAG: CPBP family intramembrane metalloprotease, partial [Moraxellaceae bacterium]